MDILALRNTLRSLGYDARIANGNCFDIHQDDNVHYLSNAEAIQLSTSGLSHPVQLSNYAARNGLNHWYTFVANGPLESPTPEPLIATRPGHKAIQISRKGKTRTIFVVRAGRAWPEEIRGLDALLMKVAALEARGLKVDEESSQVLEEAKQYGSTLTPAQRSRQDYRQADGKYAEVNACYICGTSAGLDYFSDRRSDKTDSEGNSWGDAALCLCKRCWGKLDKLPDGEAYAIALGKKPAPWLKKSLVGQAPINDESQQGPRAEASVLKPIIEASLSDTEKIAATIRGWCAIDITSGAFLTQSHGRGKGGLPKFCLILPNQTPVERGGLFAPYQWDYPHGRKVIREWTEKAAIEKANQKLKKMLGQRPVRCAAGSDASSTLGRPYKQT